MSRKTARRNAFELCFQLSFHTYNVQTERNKILEDFFSSRKLNTDDSSYISEVVNGVYANIDEIDALIEKSLKTWQPERLGKVDMAIIRVGAYEMLKMDNIPAVVSINEAVELAKRYGAEDSPPFVNGVLSGINKGLNHA